MTATSVVVNGAVTAGSISATGVVTALSFVSMASPYARFDGSVVNRDRFLAWLQEATRESGFVVRDGFPEERLWHLQLERWGACYMGGVLIPDGRVVFVPCMRPNWYLRSERE